MLAAALFAFVHHLAAFTLVAALVLEWATFRIDMTVAEARRIQLADMVYGISAGVILIVGALRVLYFEKGWQYYLADHAFLTKMLLFLIVGLVSIYPTIRFLKWGKLKPEQGMLHVDDKEARVVARCLKVELVCIVGILLLAPIMARGMR